MPFNVSLRKAHCFLREVQQYRYYAAWLFGDRGVWRVTRQSILSFCESDFEQIMFCYI